MSLKDFQNKMRELAGIKEPVVVFSGDKVVTSKKCPVTGDFYVVTVDRDKYNLWKEDGEYPQIAFPLLSDDQREFLITGMTPGEWDEMPKEEE